MSHRADFNRPADLELPQIRFCLFCNHGLVIEPNQDGACCPGCGMDLRDATFMLSGEMLGEFDSGEDTVCEPLSPEMLVDPELLIELEETITGPDEYWA